MKREILITSDGSTTIQLPDWNEQYHSKHGAIQEAFHVFIDSGLRQFQPNDKLSILEVGFGTGLNAFITYLEAEKLKQLIDYVGVEAYPVESKEVVKLNYVTELNAEKENKIFEKLHSLSWEEKHQVSKTFSITKRQQFFDDIIDDNVFDLVYFDAFGARVQPELWTPEMFKKMYKSLKAEGVLVTYSAKGSVRRAMEEVGFTVERLPGPPGKREMLRATKD
ncbi:tRNA (5-methylaminomethyl-2-thiouridine)(34)-methyltransferase MnmD [Aureibaculum sp. 2210JD6-5]|uniref:tRNA (5-methylaminomethyl-2-thiouridine)(34)-methyltransferase MnmD n=1 Tax=Aureibaculum sp. 2210JD6-5 TaxID=3103957 RepID=UPI002AAE6B93|nr:tRNA (5-methylaminomethyl-2-thiouridine)(34)-methyltransferase MnmD [Aureibaculum sp. 2210JD6-5]MDY7395792.1 tRNA (5-methylaminomethyl-2-thiouridine)(34)-methyltransferase MnmD [Aureibaculum sp. 2210JD6-5]